MKDVVFKTTTPTLDSQVKVRVTTAITQTFYRLPNGSFAMYQLRDCLLAGERQARYRWQ